jgi:hypothetical protein
VLYLIVIVLLRRLVLHTARRTARVEVAELLPV